MCTMEFLARYISLRPLSIDAMDESSVECVWDDCDRRFESRTGMKIHHCQSHGVSVKDIEVVYCENCGDDKEIPSAKANRSERHFCDNDCQAEWIKSGGFDENHDYWEPDHRAPCSNCGSDVSVGDHEYDDQNNFFCDSECRHEYSHEIVSCEYCGEEKEVINSKADSHDIHFCDNDCRLGYYERRRIDVSCYSCNLDISVPHSIFNKQNRYFCDDCSGRSSRDTDIVQCSHCQSDIERYIGEIESRENLFCDFSCYTEWRSSDEGHHPRWGGGMVTVECDQCGTETEKHPSNIERSENDFCSNECNNEHQIENSIYSNGDVEQFSYGAGWNDSKKERVRDQQDRQCYICEIDESELDHRLHVHHIQKARSFNDSIEANDIDNLVALCPSCHRKCESMSPLLPENPSMLSALS